MRKQEEESFFKWGKILKIAGIILAALIIGAAVFFVFKVRSNAKEALREAKNTRVALLSADIEMYAQKKSIFNPANENGIEDGVEGRVDQIYKPGGTYKITGYDPSTHELTGMIYVKGNYVVTFELRGGAKYWDVDYRMNVYHYDDDDIVVK